MGFGQATFEMRSCCAKRGLKCGTSATNYEDHLELELLYLSSLCAAQTRALPCPRSLRISVADFIEEASAPAGSTRSAPLHRRGSPTATSISLAGVGSSSANLAYRALR